MPSMKQVTGFVAVLLLGTDAVLGCGGSAATMRRPRP
jgi:hypothetical protein